jgi:RNA polymerase sigma-70 factor, ECF subfamily
MHLGGRQGLAPHRPPDHRNDIVFVETGQPNRLPLRILRSQRRVVHQECGEYSNVISNVHPETAKSIWQEARRRWPGVEFDGRAFEEYVARLQIDDVRLSAHGADVLLVSTVLRGHAPALATFDALLASVAGVASRIDSSPAFLDDVAQDVRVKLLIGLEPKLRGYSAIGSLAEWLRVACLRTALNLKRSDRLLPTEDIPSPNALDVFSDVHMKRFYLQEMNGAIERGFRQLSVRERMLLRLHFVDGLNIERIGVMYGAHRATVARWLVNIRERLFDQLREHLAATHGLSDTDVRSLYRILKSDVHVTISRVLQD